MKLYMDHEYPQATSSGDNSDLEDQYGEFDPDELLPSSDSDLVSHPSDNEDHQLSSSSLSPAYSATRQSRVFEDDDVDDDNEALPSFSLSSQDLDQRAPSHCDDRMQDDFLPVERSDLEYSTRPHSPLSQHSDVDDGWVPMHLVYPSMTLSPASASPALTHQDTGTQEQLAYAMPLLAHDESRIASGQDELERSSNGTSTDQTQDKNASGHEEGTGKICTELQEPGLFRTSHEPGVQAGRDVGSKIDKQMESPADIQDGIQGDDEDTSEGDIPGNMNDGFDGESQVFTLDATRPSSSDDTQEDSQQIISYVQAPPATSPSVKTLLDELSHVDSDPLRNEPGSAIFISPPWGLIKAICSFFGLLSVLFLTGFLAAEYHHASTRPAHVSVSEINYSEDNRMAVVQLHVFTADLRQIQGPSRPPRFHMRILSDDKAWSIEDAPKQPHHFAEPFVSCAWGGWCSVYLSSLQRRGGNAAGCSNTTHYLHIWFANGTRTSDQPPRVFADVKQGRCSSGAGWTSEDEGQQDSNERVYDMWTKRWRKIDYDTSQLLAPLRNIHRDHLQVMTSKVQSVVDMAFAYTQRSLSVLCKAALELAGCLSSVEDSVVERATVGFQRARRNAKMIKGATVSKAQKLLDRACCSCKDWSVRRRSPFANEHVQTLKVAIKAKLEKLPTNEVLRKADHLLFEAESKIEAALHSEPIKRLSRKIPADKIKQAADRVLQDVEGSVESLLRSSLAQSLSGKTQRILDKVKATPTGSKVVREAKTIKSDAKQLWRDVRIRLRRAGVTR